MKTNRLPILSALLVLGILMLACGSPYKAQPTQTPVVITATEATVAAATVTQTAILPLPAASVTATQAPSVLGVTTDTFVTDGTQLAAYAPGQETSQLVNDRYGSHYYRQPDLPMTAFPDMSAPKSGITYEVRPLYVHTWRPGCSSTMTAGTDCTVWATDNHTYVEGYANQWQATANLADQVVTDAGGALQFGSMDATYLYATVKDTGLQITFVLSAISLTPPAINLYSGNGSESYHWWEVPVYSPWGPLDTNLVQPELIYTVHAYGTGHQFVELNVCTDAATYISQAAPPPPDADCYTDGRDQYLPARIKGIVPNTGLWLEYPDGTVGFAFGAQTWHYQAGFYQVNNLPYPGGALGQ